MRSMQTRILDEIEGAIKQAGREPVYTKEWGNVGTIYAMDGLRTTFAIHYDFQRDGARFTLQYPKDGSLVEIERGRRYVDFTDTDKLEVLIEDVGQLS